MSFNPGGSGIAGASDVALSNPVTGNFLAYNTSVGKWQNSTLIGYAASVKGGGVETVNVLGSKTGATTIDLTTANVFTMTLGGNVTFTFSGATNSAGCAFSLYLSSGTGTRTVTWPAAVLWPGGTAPTLSSTASATDVLVFESFNGGTSWFGSLVGTNYS